MSDDTDTVDDPSGRLTTAWSLDNAGQIVGTYPIDGDNGAFVTLDNSSSVFGGGVLAAADDASQVVVVSIDSDNYPDAALYSETTDIKLDDATGGSSSAIITFGSGQFQPAMLGYAYGWNVVASGVYESDHHSPANDLFGVSGTTLVGIGTPGANDLVQIAGGFDVQGELVNAFDRPPSPVSPAMLQLEIDGANAAYARAVPDGATALHSPFLDLLDFNANGFFGMAYEQDGVVIVAFEGTQFNSSFYGLTSIAADAQILEGQWPAAFTDAILFTLGVQALAGSTPIYLTGHSLGGGEAEAVAYAAAIPFDDFSIAGGVTFGAPGLPDYFGPKISATSPIMSTAGIRSAITPITANWAAFR